MTITILIGNLIYCFNNLIYYKLFKLMFQFIMVNNVFDINFNSIIIIMLVTSEFRIVRITIKSRITIKTITMIVYEVDHESHQRN